jgi:hypothetical protein
MDAGDGHTNGNGGREQHHVYFLNEVGGYEKAQVNNNRNRGRNRRKHNKKMAGADACESTFLCYFLCWLEYQKWGRHGGKLGEKARAGS